MPRSPDDIRYTDQVAAFIGYEDPPPALGPKGRRTGNAAWQVLANWFADHMIDWQSAIRIYISRSRDIPMQQVYAMPLQQAYAMLEPASCQPSGHLPATAPEQ